MYSISTKLATKEQPTNRIRQYLYRSDTDLILWSKHDDVDAINILLTRHIVLIKVLLKQLAPNDNYELEELMQEVLIKVWCNIKQLDDPHSFKMWLSQIIVGIFYDMHIVHSMDSKNAFSPGSTNLQNMFNVPSVIVTEDLQAA